MKCNKCGHPMEPEAPRTLFAEVRGERLQVQVVAPQCSDCARVVLTGKSRRVYHRAASDAYRRSRGLLTTQEIDGLRRGLGMTWKQFAGYVCIGIATLKRWMGGEIQTPSLDLLVRLKADLTFAQHAQDELLTRLMNSGAASDRTIEVVARTTVRRNRVRLVETWTAANTDLALCA